MSEPPKRGNGTPATGWALPVAIWQEEIARAKERIARIDTARELRPTVEPASRSSDVTADELALAVEELAVAEDELRAQNEELESAHALLAAEHQRYRALFEHAPVPYFVTDALGVVLDANAAATRLVRCRVDRLRRKPLLAFAQGPSRRRLRNALTEIGIDRPAATFLLTLTPRGNRAVRVEANVTAAFDMRGRVTELRWLLVDQTRRVRRDRRRRADAERLEQLVAQRTEELKHEQQLKDRLVATVSHEFRTALAAIGGYAELLELGVRGSLTEPQAIDVRRIHNAYQHLARIVDDLLNYTKLVSGGLTLDMGDVVVTDLVRGLWDLVAPQATARNITLAVESINLQLRVRADVERARQILVNLLGNAIKFAPAGGQVAFGGHADDLHVYLVISDDGPGVPAAQTEAIFQPFVRLRADSPGTGLGLAISRDLARAMGGDLYVEPGRESGSRFVLRLPRSMGLANEDPPTPN